MFFCDLVRSVDDAIPLANLHGSLMQDDDSSLKIRNQFAERRAEWTRRRREISQRVFGDHPPHIQKHHHPQTNATCKARVTEATTKLIHGMSSIPCAKLFSDSN
jgi:hypothetical protein